MRLLRQENDRFEFRLTRREQEVFRHVLEAYPATPPEHHRLSRGTAPGARDPNQALLSESMAALKAEWRQRLEAFLANGKRFVRDGSGYRLVLEREEIEWLLRVLNDVRVGSWVRLGCPDSWGAVAGLKTLKAGPEAMRHALLLEVAAHFQYTLLAATDGTDGVGWGGRVE